MTLLACGAAALAGRHAAPAVSDNVTAILALEAADEAVQDARATPYGPNQLLQSGADRPPARPRWPEAAPAVAWDEFRWCRAGWGARRVSSPVALKFK